MPAKVYAVNGARVYIGSVHLTAVDTVSEYAADTYVEIGGISTITPYGDTAAVIEYALLAEKRVRKAKGTVNAGTMTLTMADDPADTGQIALKAALANAKPYNFRIRYDDALTTSGVGTTHYFHGLVTSAPVVPGDANKVVERTSDIAIDSAIYAVAAS